MRAPVREAGRGIVFCAKSYIVIVLHCLTVCWKNILNKTGSEPVKTGIY